VRTMWTLAMKDLRLLAREPVAMFFVLAFPLLFGVLFGLIFSGGGEGGSGEVSVLVVDRDGSDASRLFIERLDESEAVSVVITEDPVAARDRVRLGQVVALLEIPDGYGAGVRGVLAGEALPPITGAIDPARRAEAGVLEGVSAAVGFRVLAESLADFEVLDETLARAQLSLSQDEQIDPVSRGLFGTMLGAGRSLAQRGMVPEDDPEGGTAEATADDGGGGGPLAGFSPATLELESVARVRGRQPSAFELTFPQAAAWALVGCVTGFGISLVEERTNGTLLRLFVAPIRRSRIIAGKGLACFLAAVAVLVMLQVMGALVFGVRVHSVPMLALAIVSIAFGFVGIMMLLASVSRTAGAAEGFVRAVLLVMALVGGAGVPLFFMPDWMQTVSGVSPFRWAIVALEGASYRAFTLPEMLVPCGVLVGIGVVGLGLASTIFRRWTAA
jgi:ABC-2 type transport system permease protein